MKRILDEEEYQELKDKSDWYEHIHNLCIEYSQCRPATLEKTCELVVNICMEFGISRCEIQS